MTHSLIVIPTYNEKENIIRLIEKISRVVRKPHVLVVDDDSPDGTADLVSNFVKDAGFSVKVLLRRGERGLGGAYRAGFQYGIEKKYPIIVTMDADLSHDPKYLVPLLQKAQSFDLVIGARYVKGGGVRHWPAKRIFLSRCANAVARAMLGVDGNDMTSGYRAYRRELLSEMDLDDIRSNGYSFLVEMYFNAVRHNARICETPIIFTDRQKGKSKISKGEIILAIRTLLRLRYRI